MISSTTEFRVRYSETDQMGRVYYANFLVYFEVGRTHLIRQHWKPYSNLEKEGYFLPVLEARCRYHHPIGYDDLIHIETKLSFSRPTILHFEYALTNPETSALIAEGFTEHCFMHRDGKPRRAPSELYRLVKQGAGEQYG
jgi:acyl-CoA thioester hydrolase